MNHENFAMNFTKQRSPQTRWRRMGTGLWGLLGLLGLLDGCSLAPKYTRPAVQTPAAFKENVGATNLWKIAQPNDAAQRGQWWQMFNDTNLNALEKQVAISNQNIAAAFANLMSARALVRAAQAQYYPTLVTAPSVTRSRQFTGGEKTGLINPNVTEYSLPLDASWQPDLWGRVRNTVRANVA